jgi:hypothetical protein
VIPGSTTPTQATQATPSTVTQDVHTQISDFDAKLNAIEHKMQLLINTIHETQTTQMQTMMNRFGFTVQTMMSNMNLVMENLGKSLMDMQNPQDSRKQALSHLLPITQNPHGGSQNITVPSQLIPITQNTHGSSQNNTVPSPSNLQNKNLLLNQTQQ